MSTRQSQLEILKILKIQKFENDKFLVFWEFFRAKFKLEFARAKSEIWMNVFKLSSNVK